MRVSTSCANWIPEILRVWDHQELPLLSKVTYGLPSSQHHDFQLPARECRPNQPLLAWSVEETFAGLNIPIAAISTRVVRKGHGHG